MNDKTAAQRIKRLRERNISLGLKEVRVWVPKDMEQALKEVAEAFREEREVVIQEKTLPAKVFAPPKRED